MAPSKPPSKPPGPKTFIEIVLLDDNGKPVAGEAYKIVLPDGNDSALEELMHKWRDEHPYNPRSELG